jgi:hypothetical protein
MSLRDELTRSVIAAEAVASKLNGEAGREGSAVEGSAGEPYDIPGSERAVFTSSRGRVRLG